MAVSGHFLLTHLLMETLSSANTSRIVNVSSVGHTHGKAYFDDFMNESGYGNFAAYAQSKLANVLFTRELANRLKGSYAKNEIFTKP